MLRYIFTLFLLAASIPSTFSQVSDFKNIDFSKADSAGCHYKVKGVINPEKAAEDLTRNLNNDVEKFRAIFRWVTQTISYDLKLYHLNKKKNKDFRYDKKGRLAWGKRMNQLGIKRTLRNRMAVCSGYASLLETMCEHVNIKCNIISGTARGDLDDIGNVNENHSWNSVYLNNKWYLCDVTWASGYVNKDETAFTKEFKECYFLTDPDYFIANHYASDPAMTLVFDRPSLKEFAAAPIKHMGFIESKINQLYPAVGRIRVSQDSLIRFYFTSNISTLLPEIIVRQVAENNKGVESELQKRSITLERDKEGKLYFDYMFCIIGKYEMEIILENMGKRNQAGFSYAVEVLK